MFTTNAEFNGFLLHLQKKTFRTEDIHKLAGPVNKYSTVFKLIAFLSFVRLSANIVYYGGTLLTTSLFQHDEHCTTFSVLFDVCWIILMYVHTYLHACIHTHTYIDTYMSMYIHTYIHTYMHTCSHTCT